MSAKRVLILSFLIGAILFAQDASATPLLMLPDSSYAEAIGNWQGYREYKEDGFYARVDFTVYDTGYLLADSDEEALITSLINDEALGFDNDRGLRAWVCPAPSRGSGPSGSIPGFCLEPPLS